MSESFLDTALPLRKQDGQLIGRQPRRPVRWDGTFLPLLPQSQSINSAVETSALCALCEKIRSWLQTNIAIRHPGKVEETFRHHNTPIRLTVSSELGCHLCTLIIAEIAAYSDGTLPSGHILVVFRSPHENEHDNKGAILYSLELYSESEIQCRRINGDFFVLESRSFLDTPNIQNGSCSIISSSDKVWNMAQDWFEECTRSHPVCSQSTHPSSLPTRLIDVGTSVEEETFRLVQTLEDEVSGSYIALSYCWGGISTVKLTATTLREFRLGLPIASLPRTIQDAIQVVRRLNRRYLWVDVLCIVQDCPVDWKKEAASMGSIYRNAILTIAALGASSSDQGLFSQRDPLLYHPCWMFRGQDRKDFYVGSTTLAREWFEEAPLHERGWVLQERLLSPRSLNFGQLLAWECRTCFRAEFNFEKKDSVKGPFRDYEPTILRGVSSNDGARLDLLDTWYRKVLHSYSYAKLTFETDRMVAIAGIIHEFSKRFGWDNIHGLWKPFLEYELLWSVDRGIQRARIANEAPTWSWGSVGTGIWHPAQDYHIQSQCLRSFLVHDIEEAGFSDANAQGSGLCMRGTTFELRMDQAVGRARKSSVYTIEELPPGSSPVRFRADVVPTVQGPYLCLPILELLEVSRAEETGPTIYGIAIAKSRANPGTYERFGFVEYELPLGQHFDRVKRTKAAIFLV